MKKTICIFLALLIGLTATLCACKKRDDRSCAILTKSVVEDDLQFAKNAVASYYELLMSDNERLVEIINEIEKQTENRTLLHNEVLVAIDKIREMIPDVFSSEIRKYMAAKLFCESCALVFYNEYEQIVESDYKVVDWKTIDKYMVCKVNLTINYKTIKRGSDDLPVMSKIGEQTQLVIENTGNLMILDWYCADPSSFDSKIRTYELDLYNSDNWLNNMGKEKLSEKLIDECVEAFICYLGNAS